MSAALFPLRKLGVRLCAAVALLWLAACDATLTGPAATGNTGPSIDPGERVQVALLVPRSDPQAGPVAASLEAAARLALAELDANIELRVYDTAGAPSTAGAQAQRAVNEGAKIILGPLRSESSNAAALAVADDGVNVLSFSNTTSIAGGNLFILGNTFDNIATRLVGYGTGQGVDRIAVLHTNDVPGQVGRNAIQQAAVLGGADVVATEAYDLTTESLTAALQRVRPLVDSGAANGLFLTDDWQAGLAVVLQLGPEQGLDPARLQYMGLTRWDVRPDGFNLPGIEGGLFTIPSREAQAAFRNRYAQANGSQPHPLAGLGHDAVTVVATLLATGRDDALSTAQLTRSRGFDGTGGAFRLRADGTNQRALAVATIRNRQVVILDPAPTGFGGAGS